jgi:aryl-alcohol dehydrogenase-like predicted oxidoreductase
MLEERVKLGRTDLSVSPLCFGCWQMGQTYWGEVPEEDLISAVNRALDLGVNFFDTADAYGNGTSERILGKALEGHDRESFVVATKVYHHWHDDGPRHPDLTRDYILWECRQSLERLGLDYIDLYQAHAFDVLTHPEETARAFSELKEEGLVRNVGCSNYTLEELRAALRFGRMDTLQPRYNLLQREAEETLFPLCLAEEIGVLTYSSLAMGLLTGKFTGEEVFEDVRAENPIFQGETFKENAARVGKISEMATELGISTTQLVLRATVMHPAVTCAIVGVKRPEHIEDAVGMADVSLSRRQYYRVRDCLQ